METPNAELLNFRRKPFVQCRVTVVVFNRTDGFIKYSFIMEEKSFMNDICACFVEQNSQTEFYFIA